MPNPTAGEVHVDRLMTDVSVAFIQSRDNYVADVAFPQVNVEKQSDRYLTYDKGDWYRSEAAERAISAETVGGGWDIDTTPTYYAKVYGIHKDIDDQIRANADMDVDRDATEWVTQQLLLKRDINWATNNFKTGVWTTDRAGADSSPTGTQFLKWNVANSDPVADIGQSIVDQAELTGYKPNVLVLGPRTFQAVKNNASVLDRIKYTQRGFVTTDLLAGLFEVDRVVVPFVVQNTAKKGAATVMAFLYADSALLLYAPAAPSLMKPSAGYTFAWTGYEGAGAFGNRISRIRMDWIRSDRVEGEMAFDMKVVAADCGTFFSDCVK